MEKGKRIYAHQVEQNKKYVVATYIAEKPDYPCDVTRWDVVYFKDGLCYGFKGGTRALRPCDFDEIYELDQ